MKKVKSNYIKTNKISFNKLGQIFLTRCFLPTDIKKFYGLKLNIFMVNNSRKK